MRGFEFTTIAWQSVDCLTPLNFIIFYPPAYERVVWSYNKANNNLISRAINDFDWENLFFNKSINDQLTLFNVTIMNIFKNFIPNKTIICKDKDPPWINEEVKKINQISK